MFAVIETGGKQYKVEPATLLKVEKIEGNKGDQITLDKVLVLENKGNLKVGTPYVSGAEVKALIVDQGKGKKVTVFKYKPKKRIRVKTGHRQMYTTLKIQDITAG
jgi:large subunit ribosomal protein L21